MSSSNPLSNYFRQPAIYAKLPSNGNFWPPGSLDMPVNNELPVYPMTARDEIIYRTPDALFNGSAVVEVIHSCVPSIKNAWMTPSVDLDTVLIAIRIASFGHAMPISSRCPACDNEADYDIDLRVINDNIRPTGFDQSLKIGDLEIFFKPLNYQQINANSLAQYEQQKLLNNLEQADTTDEARSQTMSQALKNLTEVTIKALADSVNMIRTPNSLVNDTASIHEWIQNLDRKVFNQIRDFVLNVKRSSEIQPLTIQCQNCGHKYEQMFTLDMTRFFEDAS